MVITILEAKVASGVSEELRSTYQQALKHLDPGIVETFLLHASTDPARWQIVTLWASRAALDSMRQSGETPRGVLIFRAVGAEPVFSIFDVAGHAAA